MQLDALPLHPTSLDALFIDIGSTLLRPRGSVGEQYATAAVEHGIIAPTAEVQARFGSVFHERRMAARAERVLAYGTTESQARAFWRDVVVEVFAPWSPDPNTSHALFESLYDRFAEGEVWKVYPDGVALLEAAGRASVPCVVVSNWDARLPRLLDATGLLRYFAGVVASYEVGAEKPDPRIFDIAFERLAAQGVTARRSHVLHVGDSEEEDVAGARAAGIMAVHLDRHGHWPDAPHRVRSLDVLAGHWF